MTNPTYSPNLPQDGKEIQKSIFLTSRTFKDDFHPAPALVEEMPSIRQ